MYIHTQKLLTHVHTCVHIFQQELYTWLEYSLFSTDIYCFICTIIQTSAPKFSAYIWMDLYEIHT